MNKNNVKIGETYRIVKCHDLAWIGLVIKRLDDNKSLIIFECSGKID